MRDRVIATGKFCLLLAAALSAAAVLTAWRGHGATAEPPVRSRFPLGDTLPNVELLTADGTHIRLRERLDGKPAVLYVFGVRECAGCSNLPLEFSIIRREAPSIQPLIIASGAPADSFATFFKTTTLGPSALVDEHRALLRGLRVVNEPIVLLVDGAGRILFVDTRSASQAAQYPMGRVLHELLAIAPTSGAHP